jgi:hypothetical protein
MYVFVEVTGHAVVKHMHTYLSRHLTLELTAYCLHEDAMPALLCEKRLTATAPCAPRALVFSWPPATEWLEKAEQSPGFSVLLLRVAQDSQTHLSVRQAAAICFKNLVKRNWVRNLSPHLRARPVRAVPAWPGDCVTHAPEAARLSPIFPTIFCRTRSLRW